MATRPMLTGWVSAVTTRPSVDSGIEEDAQLLERGGAVVVDPLAGDLIAVVVNV